MPTRTCTEKSLNAKQIIEKNAVKATPAGLPLVHLMDKISPKHL